MTKSRGRCRWRKISPVVGSSSPLISPSNVDLPDPFSPSMPMRLFNVISSVTFRSTGACKGGCREVALAGTAGSGVAALSAVLESADTCVSSKAHHGYGTRICYAARRIYTPMVLLWMRLMQQYLLMLEGQALPRQQALIPARDTRMIPWIAAAGPRSCRVH